MRCLSRPAALALTGSRYPHDSELLSRDRGAGPHLAGGVLDLEESIFIGIDHA